MVYLDNASTTYPKPECVYAETMKQLSTRTWARGLVASYAYDASGKLLSLDYSDTTPDIAYTYDRLGHQLSAIAAGVSTNLYAYSRYGQLTNETVQGLVTASLAHPTDSLGRSTGLSFLGEDTTPYSVAYGYDTYGRFSSVSSSVDSVFSVVNYSHLSGSDLVSGMTASSGHAWTRSYEPNRNLISAVENTFGETVISRFDYVNDGIGRRVSRVDSGQAFQNPAFDVYSYNTRSEVSGAQRYHGTNPADTSRPFGGRGFGYDYDPIGNRLSASETVGGETLTKGYTANALNQYTSIANPDAVALRGVATNTATVTVNGDAATRDSVVSPWTPWHHALPTDNANGGVFTFAEIMAAINPPGTNTPDLVSTASGNVYAPPQEEVVTYDDDGNLVSDGRWQYTWNGENRLIKAEELVSPTNRQPYVVEYAYDHRGRMIWKTVASPNTPPVKAITYLWDDFNIIAEATAQDNATNTTYNIWGLDLDGTLQGAGGVGGLLAVVKESATYIPTYDANGNIMEYVAGDGAIAAHREYDPFGGTVVATGDANAFTHWFSTKPWCSVTGLSEYQYRKYNPVLGRWLSREPLGESESANLFVIIFNTLPNDIIDYLGAEPIKVGGACSIHGRGDENQFDSIASSCSENWEAVSSGVEILSHLRKLTKTSKNCCISEYTIAGHGWRYQDDKKERDLGSGVPGGGTDNGFYKEKTGKQAGAIDIMDLQKAIEEKDIKFCKPCSIQIYSCRVSPSFSAALAQTTGCDVVGAAGSCFMDDNGKWACGAKNSGEQAKGGYFGFYKCTPTGDMTYEGTTHEPN